MKPFFSLSRMLLLIACSAISLSTFAGDLDVTFTPSNFEGGYNISCHGGHNGSVEAFPINGTSPYFYLWSNGATTKTISNLTAGTYTVTVTDFGSHTITSSIDLIEPNASIGISLTPQNVSEAGAANGVIESVISGGTTPYTYLWSNGSTDFKIGDLSPGTYSLTVTDASGGCPATASATITEPTALQIVSITSPLHHGYNLNCHGSKDGSINLVVSGGVPPYVYSWNNGNFTQNVTELYAGLYMVKVLDDNGAEVGAQITLTEPQVLDFGFTVSTYQNGYNVSCYQCSNGEVDANPTGGVSPYSYLWNTGETTATVSNKSAGNFSVTITDANGCITGGEVALTRPDRDDWTMLGNSGSNPSTEFLGTKDSTDFVFRTNNVERLRFKANGTITMPDGSHFEKLLADRITSMNTDLHLGDSSIVVSSFGANQIYPSPNGGTRGLGIGSQEAWAGSKNSVAIGNYVRSANEYCVTIGTGIDHNHLLNNQQSAQTLYVGFNSTVPTFVVTPASGAGTTGNVGVGISSPSSKLHISGGDVTIDNLAGNGNRFIMANASGKLIINQSGVGITPWLTGGNSGTTAGVDFIGTTDIQDLVFKTHSSEKVRIVDETGNVGIGINVPIQTLDVNGRMCVRNGVIQKGTSAGAITTTSDLGLYSLNSTDWMRFVTNNQRINFYTNTDGATPQGIPVMTILGTGQVGIGTGNSDFSCGTCSDYNLFVTKGIRAEKVKVDLPGGNGWGDFVFNDDYKLKSIKELEDFLKQNKHLPNMPSAEEVKCDGIDIGEMQNMLLQKIEELALYTIDLQKQIQELKKK